MATVSPVLLVLLVSVVSGKEHILEGHQSPSQCSSNQTYSSLLLNCLECGGKNSVQDPETGGCRYRLSTCATSENMFIHLVPGVGRDITLPRTLDTTDRRGEDYLSSVTNVGREK